MISSDIETYLSLATPDGIARTLAIDGPGIQEIIGLAADPDGTAWVQVRDVPSGDEGPSPVMQISGSTFADSGLYLLKIAP